MLMIKNLLLNRNDILIKEYNKIVYKINYYEPYVSNLNNSEIINISNILKLRYKKGESLDELLPEAFSIIKECGKRVFGIRYFNSQIFGGICIHQGKIAEMKTGEGKTIMSTMPIYLNALTGQGIHIVTVNDYLSKRDSNLMKHIYGFLNISVSDINSQQSYKEKKNSYLSDITYGTNNEFSFDYLRDNMEYKIKKKRQRKLNFAIIDEIDSILIDEARTPLIISGFSESNINIYIYMNTICKMLIKMISTPDKKKLEPYGDFWIDEKNQQIYISESGHEKIEIILNNFRILSDKESLYESNNINLIHHIIVALRANNLFFLNRHYVIKNKKVVIVDEFTGRLMIGRRWSDGLHQAIEAKEKVKIQEESNTLASITFQNYFKMYDKISGMTGTAKTEAYEFQKIYNLETVTIPTNKPIIRKDKNDQIFKTDIEKYEYILKDINRCYKKGQPVLVGTTNIENSELLSKILIKNKLPHKILNAKNNDFEAKIISEAGKSYNITIATNMAGRGTDIVLGGSINKFIDSVQKNNKLSFYQKTLKISKIRDFWKPLNLNVKKLGGLHVIGTERHESRRIDNQLRGRSGRQGDPGSSRFYLSLEDPLMRIFAGNKINIIMNHLKINKLKPIESNIISKSIELAQKKVESKNFEIRKQLVEYDEISNIQRKIIYIHRNNILNSNENEETINKFILDSLKKIFREYLKHDYIELYFSYLQKIIKKNWKIDLDINRIFEFSPYISKKKIFFILIKYIKIFYKFNKNKIGKIIWNKVEKQIVLKIIDRKWQEHISFLDFLKQGIHLRGYAQKNPKQEYRKESFKTFGKMFNSIKEDISYIIVKKLIKYLKNFKNNMSKNNMRNKSNNLRNNFIYNSVEFYKKKIYKKN